MQTFLPFPDFNQSAKVLDQRRLGSQRNEAFVILRACIEWQKAGKWPRTPWSNHPAVLMWIGSEKLLLGYIRAICQEWANRGNTDSVLAKSEAVAALMPESSLYLDSSWLLNPAFFASHRASLLRKSEHYKQFGWEDSLELPCIWPVLVKDLRKRLPQLFR